MNAQRDQPCGLTQARIAPPGNEPAGNDFFANEPWRLSKAAGFAIALGALLRLGRKRGLLGAAFVALLGLGALVRPAAALELTRAEIQNRRCFECHGQRHIADLSPAERSSMVKRGAADQIMPPTQPSAESSNQPATRPGLFVAPDALSHTIHVALACVDCHAAAKTLPHAASLGPANCTTACHAKAASSYLQGAHAEIRARGDRRAPTCSTCHGTHDILPTRDRASRTYPLNVIKTCGDCHAQHKPSANGRDGKKDIQVYLDSVHGRGVLGSGLIVAATCVDCHSSHEVRPAKDPLSTVNRANVPQTCGRCHMGVEEIYQTSIHGRKLADGDDRAPVCSDCHTAHGITRTQTPAFMLDIVNECGQCHDQISGTRRRVTSLYDTYRRSYHGQVNQLGYTRAARCSDCHGAHDIQPIANPASRLSGQNRIDTCRRCHKGADAKFARFEAHGDFHDAQRYPLLHGVWLYFILVMSATFSFFGVHTLLWFVRSGFDHVRRRGQPRPPAPKYAIKRFSKTDRVNHILVIISFFGLTLTGMPLLFSEQAWAKALATIFGGASSAGVFHRFFAIMLMGNLVVHIVGLIRRVRRYSLRAMLTGPNTLLPRWKDVADCLGMFRWFFTGKGKPVFDHWTYWEKFDYWAEIFGTAVIGGTGLMLWFPLFFAQFLPGWFFNVAMIVHGYEALLAAGFIFTIHFFNANLRPEKFPVDDVMFTGVMPEEELKHERRVEYDRLVQSGRLEALRVASPPRWQRRLSVVGGLLAMAIGAGLVILIVLAGLKAI